MTLPSGVALGYRVGASGLRPSGGVYPTRYPRSAPEGRVESLNNPLAGSFETLIMRVQGPTLRDAAYMDN